MKERKKDSAKGWKGKGKIISHFVTVKTKVRDLEILKKALGRMGLTFTEGKGLSVSIAGQSSKVDIKFDNAVGLAVQADGTYAMVGDPYYSKNSKLKSYYKKENKFVKELGTAYAVEEATLKLSDQGFSCSENAEAEVDEYGMITMVFENFC